MKKKHVFMEYYTDLLVFLRFNYQLIETEEAFCTLDFSLIDNVCFSNMFENKKTVTKI